MRIILSCDQISIRLVLICHSPTQSVLSSVYYLSTVTVMIMWVVLAMVAAVGGLEISDEEYHRLPRLFHQDDWEECRLREGDYCVGTFELLINKSYPLFNTIQHLSTSKYYFNHSLIHRSLCLDTSCQHINGSSPETRFQQCTKNLTKTQYGVEANLVKLGSCRRGVGNRKVDSWDMTFAYIVGMIIVLNMAGTAYDALRRPDWKPIKPLIAWSLIANCRRLIADHGDGDQRLTALKPVQGFRSLSLILVMLAHSTLTYHTTYLQNPQYLEKSSQEALSAYLQNGTAIVQTFILISCFLLAYNLLIHLADHPKKQVNLIMLAQCFILRIIRISPLYLFFLGFITTWWSHVYDGPLWATLVEAETAHCRDKWWTHALFVNNFVKPDERCLIHTWFLAVDMQLYVISTILTLLLVRCQRVAPKVLGVLFLGAVAINFCIIYNWQIQPVIFLMFPESMRTLFVGRNSFKFLYTAPWDSLPSALLGLLLAFVYHQHNLDNYRPAQNKWLRHLLWATVPVGFLWIFSGYWIKDINDPLWSSVHASLDRPVFAILIAYGMYGCFHKFNSFIWNMMTWRSWQILGRMSLPIFLTHMTTSILLLAVRSHISVVSTFDIGGHWFCTIFLTYLAAVPLHLLIEVPTMKFLQSFLV